VGRRRQLLPGIKLKKKGNQKNKIKLQRKMRK
jgi:hypothetical protein